MAQGSNRALELQLSTVAEISRAAGFNPEGLTPDSTARDVELSHEKLSSIMDSLLTEAPPTWTTRSVSGISS